LRFTVITQISNLKDSNLELSDEVAAADVGRGRKGFSYNYGYDANGSLTSEANSLGGSSEASNYGYDSRNRLTSWNKQAKGTTLSSAAYLYDGQNSRLSMSYGGQTTSYLQDGAGGSAVVLQENKSGGSGGSSNYLYPLGEVSPLYQSDGSGSGLWYHNDDRGSVRALTNGTSPTISSTNSYSAFGLSLGQSGKVGSTHGFEGEQLDPTGLYFNTASYYSPALGRSISQGSFGYPGGGMGQGYASSGMMLAGSLEPEIISTNQFSLLGSNQSGNSLKSKVEQALKEAQGKNPCESFYGVASVLLCTDPQVLYSEEYLKHLQGQSQTKSQSEGQLCLDNSFLASPGQKQSNYSAPLTAFGSIYTPLQLGTGGGKISAPGCPVTGKANSGVWLSPILKAEKDGDEQESSGSSSAGGGGSSGPFPGGGGDKKAAKEVVSKITGNESFKRDTNSLFGSELQLPDGSDKEISKLIPEDYARSVNVSAGRSARRQAGEDALQMLYGPGRLGQPEFSTSLGGRRPDLVVDIGNRIYAYESNNVREKLVAGNDHKLREISKDVELRRTIVGYTPIWIFWERGPTGRLKAALRRNKISYIIYDS